MRKEFVSHPLTGDFEGNRRKADKICRKLLKQGILPISPLHLFSFIDKEDDELRNEILKVCFTLINHCDAVRIYGDSKGCRLEKTYAQSVGKEIKEEWS